MILRINQKKIIITKNCLIFKKCGLRLEERHNYYVFAAASAASLPPGLP